MVSRIEHSGLESEFPVVRWNHGRLRYASEQRWPPSSPAPPRRTVSLARTTALPPPAARMRHPNDFLETRPSLLAALKDGAVDQDWREFFALYAPPIHRIARHRNLTAADAEDIVQQVMLAVLGHIKDFRYERDRSRFRQWIIRIAENKICDFVRKRKPMARSTEVLDQQSTSHGGANGEGGAEAMWEREWRRQDLMYCLDQVAADISPRRMMAFDMYVMHGVSAERTARELGMTTAYVYVTRNQVLQMLHEHLRRLEADGGDGTPTQEDRP